MQAGRNEINKKICKAVGETISELKGEKKNAILAYESDIPRSVLIYVLRGVKDPQLTTFMRIASGLNIRPSELLKLIENKIENEFEL